MLQGYPIMKGSLMETTVEVGKLTKVVTKDGRTFIGLLSGYAEVGTGDEIMEELYLTGLGKDAKVVSVHEIEKVDQAATNFVFTHTSE